MIDLKDLEIGTIYKVHAHNFSVAVYAGDGGFIGIRTKFGNRFLDTEFEWTTSSSFGTARAEEAIGKVPSTIKLVTSLGSECEKCGKLTNFDMSRPERLRWQHDDGTTMCEKAWSISIPNRELFSIIEETQDGILGRR